MEMRGDVKFNGNEAKDLRLENVAADKSVMDNDGIIFYQTTDKKYKAISDGKVLIFETKEAGIEYLVKGTDGDANKAGGYPQLDSNAKVEVAQLPTGNNTDLIPILKEQIQAGYVLRMNANGKVEGVNLAGGVQFKDVVDNFSDLASKTDARVGDMYNIRNQFTDNGKTYAAGTNVVYLGTGGDTSDGKWDILGGTIDVSSFVTITKITEMMESDFTENVDDNHIPTTKAVKDALDTKVDKLTEKKPAAGTAYYKVVVNEDGLVTTDSAGSMASTELSDSDDVQRVANMDQTLPELATADATHYPSTAALRAVNAALLTSIEALEGQVGTNLQEELAKKVDKNTDITAGTHTKITYDAKGLVTKGEDLKWADIEPAVQEGSAALVDDVIDDIKTALDEDNDNKGYYIKVTEKGAANGVATLDASTKVPIAQVPTGTTKPSDSAGVVPLIISTTAPTDGDVMIYDVDAGGFKYHSMGSVPLQAVIKTINASSFAGGSKTTTIAHGLSQEPVDVTIKNASGEFIWATVTADATNVTITMNPVPSAEETFKVFIIG